MNSKSMAMETLGLHQPVEILDHKWVVDGGDELDVAVMAWAVV